MNEDGTIHGATRSAYLFAGCVAVSALIVVCAVFWSDACDFARGLSIAIDAAWVAIR